MQQYLNVGTRVYTLPEKEGSRFVLRGGNLNYVADNPYGNTKEGNISESGHDMVNWDDYNVHIDKSYQPLVIAPKTKSNNPTYNKNVTKYSLALSNNKEKLQKDLGLTSDEYNRLAQLAMGLAEQESKFGTAKRYTIKNIVGDAGQDIMQGVRKNNIIQNISDAILSISNPAMLLANVGKYYLNGQQEYNSKGITQIKYKGDIKSKDLQKLYNQYGINEDNLNNPDVAAIATLTRLAYIYNTEVKGGKFKDKHNNRISPYDALLYKYQGKHKELSSGNATPLENIYIKNVKRYADNFNYYEKRKVRK